MNTIVDTVDVSIDQVIDSTVSFDFNTIDNADIPFSQDHQLIELLNKVFHTHFNSSYICVVIKDFVVQLLDILTLRSAV